MAIMTHFKAYLFLTLISFSVLSATYTTNGDGWVETIKTNDAGTCFRCNEGCDSDDEEDKEVFVAPDQTNPSDNPNRNW